MLKKFSSRKDERIQITEQDVELKYMRMLEHLRIDLNMF